MNVYLAGPDVFLPDAAEIGRRKVEICARHGLNGRYPLDNPVDLTAADASLRIYKGLEVMMDECSAIIANLTPFRGVSADVGSVYEMGFMRGLGRPVFGYSNDPRTYFDRVAAGHDNTLRRRPSGEHEDADGMAVENFQQHDNLMLAGGIIASGGALVIASLPQTERYASLTTFERCVETAADRLARPETR